MKRMDTKSWIIIGLLFFTLIFGYRTFFHSDDSKDTIRELEKEIDKLSKEREDNKKIIIDLKKDLTIMERDVDDNRMVIDSLNSEIMELSTIVSDKKKELDKIIKKMNNQSVKIKEFEENPPKREGSDLFNSLKDKLK